MKQLPVQIVNKSPHALPAYQTAGAAGTDICAWLEAPLMLQPMERRLIPTGLYIALPEGLEAQVRPRSGISFKKGITLVNAIGTIDSDYRGEILVPVINLSPEVQEIRDGERIAQLVVARYEQVGWEEVAGLEETARSAGGFGHTGS